MIHTGYTGNLWSEYKRKRDGHFVVEVDDVSTNRIIMPVYSGGDVYNNYIYNNHIGIGDEDRPTIMPYIYNNTIENNDGGIIIMEFTSRSAVRELPLRNSISNIVRATESVKKPQFSSNDFFSPFSG